MLRFAAPAFLAFGLVAAPVARAAPVDDLARAVAIPGVVALMREEGLAYGASLAEEMLPDGPDAAWMATVGRIYDTGRMEAAVRGRFDAVLSQTDLAPLIAFFRDGPGARFVALELSAREAMLDDSVDEAARAAFHEMEAEDSPRLHLMQEFVTANDLVDWNVQGALNASVAFYRGLAQGGRLDLPEDEILANVWESEPEVRADTGEWVYGFLLMAYGPMSDADLQAYIDLSRTPEGAALNRALFEGFDAMYLGLSQALGAAVALAGQSQDL